MFLVAFVTVLNARMVTATLISLNDLLKLFAPPLAEWNDVPRFLATLFNSFNLGVLALVFLSKTLIALDSFSAFLITLSLIFLTLLILAKAVTSFAIPE